MNMSGEDPASEPMPIMPYASNAPGPLGTPKPKKEAVVVPAVVGFAGVGAVLFTIVVGYYIWAAYVH